MSKDDDVQKSQVPPVFVFNGRVPGQVPSKGRMRTLGQMRALRNLGAHDAEGAANLRLGNLAGAPQRVPVPKGLGFDGMPGDVTEERLLAQDAPMLRPSSIVDNLGLAAGTERQWSQFLAKAAAQSSNEVVFRKAVYERLMESGFDGLLRKAIFVRALSHWRALQKGELEVWSQGDDGELSKALFIGPRGGRWADPQHTIPYDPKKHAKKKIVVIDKTATQPKPKQTPSNKHRQEQAQRDDRKKKVQVIDKTAEEAPEGGTAGEKQTAQHQPSKADKESAKTTPQLLLFDQPKKPPVREPPAVAQDADDPAPTPKTPEQALADAAEGKDGLIDDTIHVGYVKVSPGVWGELEALEMDTLSDSSSDGKWALVLQMERAKGRDLPLTEKAREYLISALDNMRDIAEDKVEAGGGDSRRYRSMMRGIKRLQKDVEAIDVDAARAKHLKHRADMNEKFAKLGIESPYPTAPGDETGDGGVATKVDTPEPEPGPPQAELGAVAKFLTKVKALQVIKNPAGTWSFVGSVPMVLSHERKDGEPLTDRNIEMIKHTGSDPTCKSRAWPTKEAALKAAAEAGYEPEGVDEPGAPAEAESEPGWERMPDTPAEPDMAKLSPESVMAFFGRLKPGTPISAGDLAQGFYGQAPKAAAILKKLVKEGKLEKVPVREGYEERVAQYRVPGPEPTRTREYMEEQSKRQSEPTTTQLQKNAYRAIQDRFVVHVNKLLAWRGLSPTLVGTTFDEDTLRRKPGVEWKQQLSAEEKDMLSSLAQLYKITRQLRSKDDRLVQGGVTPGLWNEQALRVQRKLEKLRAEPGWERMPESEAEPESEPEPTPEKPKFTLHEPAPPLKMAGRLLEQLQEAELPDELANVLANVDWGRTVKVSLGETERKQLQAALAERITVALRKTRSKKADVRAEGRSNLGRMSRVMQQLDPSFEPPSPRATPKRAGNWAATLPKKRKSSKKRKSGGEGSRREVAVEQGEHVWGSRKDRWEIRNPSDLDNLTPDEQAKVTTKAKLFQAEEIDDLLAGGSTPACVLMRKAIESCIAAKPYGNSLESRKLYVEGLDFVAKSLDACKTHTDVKDFVAEFQAMARGKRKLGTLRLGSEQVEQIRDQLATEMHIPIEVPWQERVQLEQAKDAAYEAYQQARRNLEGEDVARRVWEKATEAHRASLRGSLGFRIDSRMIYAKAMNVDPDVVQAVSRTGDGSVTVWAQDKRVMYIEESKYAMMAAALGSRFSTLINKSSNPKVWREARYYGNRLADMPDDKAEAELRERLQEKKRTKRGERQRFHWEREVPGEVIRTGGKPIPGPDPEKFAKEFGLANVQFGGWVSEDDAKAHLAGAYGAMFDLADLLGVDPKVISLNGRLSIGIGARGGGRHSAHYEPMGKIINITKVAGGGSLAHEWGHALDNILSIAHNPESSRSGMFMSGNSLEGLPEEVQAAMRDLMITIRQSNFYKDAQALSPGYDGYFQRPHELFARAFESWVEDTLVETKRESSYLVSGTRKIYPGKPVKRNGEVIEAQMYPQGEERKTIGAAMGKLVATLRESGAIKKAMRFLLDLRPRFTVTEDVLQKAKYKRRWKGPDGKWRYEYDAPKRSRKKSAGLELAESLHLNKYMEGMSLESTCNLVLEQAARLGNLRAEQSAYGIAYARQTGRVSGTTELALRKLSGQETYDLMADVIANTKTIGDVAGYLNKRFGVLSQYVKSKDGSEFNYSLDGNSLQKSMVVLTADELLQKSEPRGGAYYKRVPVTKAGAKRKWRYFYKPEDYDSRDDAHTGGEDNQKRYLSGQVAKCIKAAGKKGCGPEALSGLVKKYGAKKVAKTLRESVNGGTLAFKKGKFSVGSSRGENETVAEQREPGGKRNRRAGRRAGSDARPGKSREPDQGRVRTTGRKNRRS